MYNYITGALNFVMNVNVSWAKKCVRMKEYFRDSEATMPIVQIGGNTRGWDVKTWTYWDVKTSPHCTHSSKWEQIVSRESKTKSIFLLHFLSFFLAPSVRAMKYNANSKQIQLIEMNESKAEV